MSVSLVEVAGNVHEQVRRAYSTGLHGFGGGFSRGWVSTVQNIPHAAAIGRSSDFRADRGFFFDFFWLFHMGGTVSFSQQ